MNLASSENNPAEKHIFSTQTTTAQNCSNQHQQQQAEHQGDPSIQPTLMINFNEISPIDGDCDEKEEEKYVTCNTPARRVSIPDEEEAQCLAKSIISTTATTISVTIATTSVAVLNDNPTTESGDKVCEIVEALQERPSLAAEDHHEVANSLAESAAELVIDLALTSSESPRRKSSKSKSGVNDEDTVSKSSDTSGELVRGSSVLESGCNDKPKSASSRLSVRAKKKSWYNVLYPNYKSRTQDFKKLFEAVPKEERLIVDYSCALQREILVQGRLYVSQNYVCFHANIFRWETYLTLKWRDVTAITKEKTALVIPNAISISTASEKYFFATFTSRDKAFLMLFRIWQNTLMHKQMSPQELWQWVHKCYGDELGLTTDDEDYIDPSSLPNDSECDLDFVTALEESASNAYLNASTDHSDLTPKYTKNPTQLIDIANNPNKSDHSSSASSGASATTNNKTIGTATKSKKYFFSGKDATKTVYSFAHSTSTSGSDNRASDHKCKPTPMKTNARELTLISAKPDESTGSAQSTQQPPTPAESHGSAPARDKDTKTPAATYDGVKRKAPKNSRLRDDSLVKNLDPMPTDVSDSSDSDDNKTPFVATTECNSTHEGRQLVHTILPINIETLFSLLFSKSKFLLDFHAMRKSTDMAFGDWVTNEEGKRTRLVNVTVQLAASVGPKTSKVTEHQEIRDCSKDGELYSIDINSVNAGIPYADSFSVLMHYCLVRTVDDHTMLSVHAQIKYKKSIWGVVKGFIEKNTWAGLEDFFSALLHALQSETCIPPAKGKGRRPRRGTAAQIRPPDETPFAQAKIDAIDNAAIATATYHGPHEATAQPAFAAVQHSAKHKWLSVFVILLMGFLILLNVLLLLKLWKLEERINDDLSQRARLPNLASLKQLPNNHEEWIELLRQQEILHEAELKKWHKVLQTAIELLKKTEKTLAELIFR